MLLVPIHPSPWLLETIGSMAAFCTTVSLFPQLLRVWRRKSAADISFSMFLIFGVGVLCWFLYGVGVRSWPMMVGNGLTFIQAAAILVMKIRYASQSRGPHPGAISPKSAAALR